MLRGEKRNLQSGKRLANAISEKIKFCPSPELSIYLSSSIKEVPS
jgi:hypothetical protein